MLNSHKLRPQPSHVTVKFGDGVHEFLLTGGATLTELADCVDILGEQHGGAPLSIHVEFHCQGARSARHTLSRNPLSH
jgi:hypothetical protein